MNHATLSNTAARTHALDAQQLIVLSNRPGTRIKVLAGRVWLTEEGQAGDQFAVAGEELCLSGRGRSIVEALGSARVQLVVPTRAWVERLSARLASLLRQRSPVLARGLMLALSLLLSVGVAELLVRGMQQA